MEKSLHEFERPFFMPKDSLDTINSVSWFFMDAFWMTGFSTFAGTLILSTIASGILLTYIEKRPNVFWINMSINSWIWMNTLWMCSDFYKANIILSQDLLSFARGSFLFGVVCILMAVVRSHGKIKETFSHFRRFRVMKL